MQYARTMDALGLISKVHFNEDLLATFELTVAFPQPKLRTCESCRINCTEDERIDRYRSNKV